MELQHIVPTRTYESLVKRLRDAERFKNKVLQQHGDEDRQTLDVDEVLSGSIDGLKIELRHCPQCYVRIEKNEGCNHVSSNNKNQGERLYVI